MRIDVRFRGIEESGFLRDYVLRRFHHHLARFRDEVDEVVVRIADINGPRGGVDKTCSVTARGRNVGTLPFGVASDDAYTAVDLAVEKVTSAVVRELRRGRARPARARSA